MLLSCYLYKSTYNNLCSWVECVAIFLSPFFWLWHRQTMSWTRFPPTHAACANLNQRLGATVNKISNIIITSTDLSTCISHGLAWLNPNGKGTVWSVPTEKIELQLTTASPLPAVFDYQLTEIQPRTCCLHSFKVKAAHRQGQMERSHNRQWAQHQIYLNQWKNQRFRLNILISDRSTFSCF